MNLGEKVKLARERCGLSQEELAKKAGMSQSFIASIENGSRNPSKPSGEKLAKILGVKYSYLVIDTVDDITDILSKHDSTVRRAFAEALDEGLAEGIPPEEIRDYIRLRAKHKKQGT
jgi:transcriptional regulator with XRE-family HTH domain